ncbi:MAG: restriction endonuclease subunit S [Deltaproteobacteria bacterium]|nr:restriction endonuclease subunit S [Deltaproteobacteria bacterium]
MNDLPINWTCARLGEVIFDFQAGFACGKKDVKDGLVHLRMNNIDVNGKINTDLIRRVPVHLAKDHHYLQKGDILFCSTNSSKLVGKCTVFELNEKAAFSNHLTRLRVNPEIINNKLLQLYLWNFWKKGGFESRCKHWVNQSTLPKAELLLTEILLPPLNEQRRIVTKLEKLLQKVDACKERLDKIPVILKRFRQSILAAACSGRLTADWRKENEWNFDEWAEVLLKDVASSRLGKMLDKVKNIGEPTRYLRNLNVRWFSFELTDLAFIRVTPEEKNQLSIRN